MSLTIVSRCGEVLGMRRVGLMTNVYVTRALTLVGPPVVMVHTCSTLNDVYIIEWLRDTTELAIE